MWPRVIVSLLLRDGELVKTFSFSKWTYVGDPVNTVRILNQKHVDELVIFDISSECHRRGPDFKLLSRISNEAFMPVTYGGGISNFSQASELFNLGIEKISLETNLADFHLLTEISSVFGKQALVGTISYSFVHEEIQFPLIAGIGEIGLIEFLLRAEASGLGELILYSRNRDGSRGGYDVGFVSEVASQLSIPVIGLGGANSREDIFDLLESGASGAAAGTMFCLHGQRNAVLLRYLREFDFDYLAGRNQLKT